jgi:glycosyltransferase involved in cell wall biosynthesis
MNSAQPATIARVIARLNVGGPAMQAILLTDAFRRRGYRTLLLTGEVAAGEASMEYLADAKDVEPIRLAGMSRSIVFYKDFVVLWQLIRILRREKPLIIHTHTAKAGTLGRLAAVVAGVPIRVHTFHGHVFRGYFPALVTRLFVSIERWLARHSDCIIAISDSQKRELVDVYRIAPAEKIAVIPLGLDLDPFLHVARLDSAQRGSVGIRGHTPVVGWIGRLTPIKAPNLFLDCAVALRPALPGARFVMVGDGELRRECEERIQREGLGSAVSLAGWRRQLAPLYAKSDLVVSTSVNEGTPVALLEAMASARPFVATNVGGVRDLMVGCGRQIDGAEVFDNGILVPQDVERVAYAVRFLLERPELRLAMGKAGREFVRSRFSHHRLANDLEALYLRLAHSKGLLPHHAPSPALEHAS